MSLYSAAELSAAPELMVDSTFTVVADLSADQGDAFYGGVINQATVLTDGRVLFVASGGVRRHPPTTLVAARDSKEIAVMPTLQDSEDVFLALDHVALKDGVFITGLWERTTEARLGRSAWLAPIGGDWRRIGVLPREWLVAHGAFADGSVVFETVPQRLTAEGGAMLVSKSVLRVPREVWRDPEGGRPLHVDTLLSISYEEERVELPWSYSTVPIAVASDRIWVARSEAPIVTAISMQGRPLVEVEWEAGDHRVDVGALEEYLVGTDERRPGRGADLPDRDELEAGASYATVARLLAGSGGELFVLTRSLHPDTGLPVWDRQWLMMESDGSLAGKLTAPEDVRVLFIGNTYALGVVDIEPDGQQLRRYPMRPRAPR